MAKKPNLHLYSDEQAFQRIMLLIATLVKYPGVGCADSENRGEVKVHHDALQLVQQKLQEVAAAAGMAFPEGYPATATIRKDLETLRRYGILEQRMYRWGYYLGTGAMNLEELRIAFHALASSAKYQGNSQAKKVHEVLKERLKALNLELNGEFFYPVRQHLNRAIIHTDPDEMRDMGEYRNTLFHQLDMVEKAIIEGQVIEISRASDPYHQGRVGMYQVYPLQLIYHDIAWYLIYEYYPDGYLAVGRVNRFADYCRIIKVSARGLNLQYQRLLQAQKLLNNGWGLFLGTQPEQQAELTGKLRFQEVKVRFFEPVIPFILEGDRRHSQQRIEKGKKDKNTGKLMYVDYIIQLPPRSFKEFMLWVFRHLNNAQVLSPPELVEQHHQAAMALVERYR